MRQIIGMARGMTRYVPLMKRAAAAVGYDHRHWIRVVGIRECQELLRALDFRQLDALEISAGETWKHFGFRSYTEMNFPDHDICVAPMERQFDLVIADNVFEHLLRPWRAAQNVLAMLRPGGYFLNITPFLVRIHDVPIDCTRWTETGMRAFLADVGFEEESMKLGSWGNRRCVASNLNYWAPRGWFGSLRNEPMYPVQVWALAKKPV